MRSTGSAAGGGMAEPPAARAVPRGGAGTRALRALRLVHPFPTALNAVAALLLALVAVGGWPGRSMAVRLTLTMLAVQGAIGTVNDLVDRELDAATKPWKPIPSGAVRVETARLLGLALIAGALGLGTTLGPAAWALSTAGMAVGLAYDLWLKRSRLSGLTYAVALPLVPLWVWTATGRFAPALVWVVPLGLLLGGSLQLLNALPDLEGDSAHGVRGTVQWLGRGRALAAAWGGYLGAITAALALGLVLGHDRRLLLAGSAGAAALLVVAVAAYARRPCDRTLQLGWHLLAPGAGLLAVTWLAALG